MPLDAHIQEYIKSDYGLIFKGTHVNVHQQPWSFGQVCGSYCERVVNPKLYFAVSLYLCAV